MSDVPFHPVGDYARAFATRLFEAVPYGISLEAATELKLLAQASINEVADPGDVVDFYRAQFKVLSVLAASAAARALMVTFEAELQRLADDRRPRYLRATLGANRLQSYLVNHPEHPLTRTVDVENVTVTHDAAGFHLELPLLPGAERRFAEAALHHLLALEPELSGLRTLPTRVVSVECDGWERLAA